MGYCVLGITYASSRIYFKKCSKRSVESHSHQFWLRKSFIANGETRKNRQLCAVKWYGLVGINELHWHRMYYDSVNSFVMQYLLQRIRIVCVSCTCTRPARISNVAQTHSRRTHHLLNE